MRYFFRSLRVPITGNIDEAILPADPVEVNHLGAAWRRAGERESLLSNQRIQQAGLSDITPAKERNLRQSRIRKLIRPRRAQNEFRFHTTVPSRTQPEPISGPPPQGMAGT